MPVVQALVLSTALLIAAPGGAADRLAKDRQPVQMYAEGGIQVDLERRVGVATKDVVIWRDDITVCCDRAEAEYDERQIRKVTCSGRVVIVRPDGTQAAADLAVFEAKVNAVTLEGGAKVWTKDARLSGARIVYDIGKDKLSVVGGSSRFAFDPKGKAPPRGLRRCKAPGPAAP